MLHMVCSVLIRQIIVKLGTYSALCTCKLTLFFFHFSPYSDFLDVQVYLTRGWREEQAAAIRIREEDETDAITGFQAKTNYGRPDWPKIFDSMSLAHPK